MKRNSENAEMNVEALRMVAELAVAALAMRDALRASNGPAWGPHAEWVDEVLESLGYGPDATADDEETNGGIVPSVN